MFTKQPKIVLTVEIDQSRYLGDEDYTGIDLSDITDRQHLGSLLDGGYYRVKISLESEAKPSENHDWIVLIGVTLLIWLIGKLWRDFA